MSNANSIERTIGDAALALCKADADILALGPDLRTYYDQDAPAARMALIIRCDQLENENLGGTGRGIYWRSRLSFICIGFISDNTDGERLDRLTRAAQAELFATTPAALTAALTGYTINGIVGAEPIEEDYNEGVVARGCAVTLHLQEG